MFDSESCLRLFQLDSVIFKCRPTHLKTDGMRRRAEYVLEIHAAGKVYSRIDLTDDQRKQLLLELNRGPKNDVIILKAEHAV